MRQNAPSMIQVLAEMVASVVAVLTPPGAAVETGDTLVVVESMKMEIPIVAPGAGTVAAVNVAVGDVIQEGDVLAVIDE